MNVAEDAGVAEAVALIDAQLISIKERAIISTADVSDLLLDLRLLLTVESSSDSSPEPAGV